MDNFNSPYNQNVRFQIAKSQIDQLFVKWLSSKQTENLISSLIQQVNKPGPQLTAPPSPIFISNIYSAHSPKNKTPPRSPSGDRYMMRTMSPKTSEALIQMKGQFREDSIDFGLQLD